MLYIPLIVAGLLGLWSCASLIRLAQLQLAEHKYKPIYDKAFDDSWANVRATMPEIPLGSSQIDLLEYLNKSRNHTQYIHDVDKWCDNARRAYFSFFKKYSFMGAPLHLFQPIWTEDEIRAFSVPYSPDVLDAEEIV